MTDVLNFVHFFLRELGLALMFIGGGVAWLSGPSHYGASDWTTMAEGVKIGSIVFGVGVVIVIMSFII